MILPGRVIPWANRWTYTIVASGLEFKPVYTTHASAAGAKAAMREKVKELNNDSNVLEV